MTTNTVLFHFTKKPVFGPKSENIMHLEDLFLSTSRPLVKYTKITGTTLFYLLTTCFVYADTGAEIQR